MKQLVKSYLEIEPRARERAGKDRALVNLLIKLYPALQEVGKETLIAAVQDFNSMDRYWRMILMETPELRGTDYDSKEKIEKRYEESLGYLRERTGKLI